MTNIIKAQKASSDKSLDKLIRYDEGIMSKREWLNMQFKKGATVEISTKNKVQFDRVKFNRMDWNQQQEYELKCNEKVQCFKLTPKGDESYFDITKTEYEYFINL